MGVWYFLALWVVFIYPLRGQEPPANSIFYQCNDTFVSVSVKVDPYGTNKRLDPAGLTLGRCPVSSTTALYGYFVFEYQYNTCGFNRMDMGEGRTYFTNLVYKPTQASVNTPFTKEIICIVNRIPTPLPMLTTVMESATGMSNFTFSYRFMNDMSDFNFFVSLDDFSDASDAKDFVLGFPINLELSVDIGHHMPLRLFIDEGAATSTKDFNLLPKYDLITKHGCFIDGKVADSRFVEQSQSNRIWLTFPAMSFVVPSDQIYLTFKLVVWDPKSVTALKKACSYIRDTQRWELLGGANNNICQCCENSCNSSKRKRSINGNEEGGLFHTMVLGPFKVRNPSGPGIHGDAVNTSEAEQTDFQMPPAVGALLLELAVLLLLCIGVVLYSRSKQNWTHPEGCRLMADVH
ncbi:zona pellucida sperm-binding protein 3-like [Gastrophryne carolinensis]